MVISVCWSHFPIPNSNEIKLSSFSSNAPPTFIRPHILTDKKKKKKKWFQTGKFLSSYEAFTLSVSTLILPSFPSMTTGMLYVFQYLGCISIYALGSIFFPLSGILHHCFFLPSSIQPTSLTKSFQMAFQHMQVSSFKTKHMSLKLLLYFSF